jgi:hypothetical protein
MATTAKSNQDEKKILTAVDRSTKAVLAANTAFENATKTISGEVSNLAQQLVTLATDVEFKSSELAQIEADITVKTREAAAELTLRVKEDKQKVLDELLRADKLTALPTVELNSIKKELEDAQTVSEDKLQAVRDETQKQVTQSLESRINTLTSEHKVEIATLKAQAQSDKTTIELLNRQITQLQKTADDNREAEIAKAQAAAQAKSVVVNTTK